MSIAQQRAAAQGVRKQQLSASLAALTELQRRASINAERLKYENSLSAFFSAAWRVLEPGRPLVWSWHYDYLCEHLELIARDEFQRVFPGKAGLIINVPRRTAKSTLATVCYPAWSWLKNPARRFMCASYSAELSTDHSLRRRDLILSDWFQGFWKTKFTLKTDQREKGHFDNNHLGSMLATSVGGTAIGRGGDSVILDDPMSATDALSDAERKTANTWVDNTIRFSFNDPSSGVLVLIMQRLHELDTTGYVLEQEPERWVHLRIPLEEEELTTYHYPVSGRDHIRQPGDVLQPERYPVNTVRSMKARRLEWAGQCQQRPAPLEGNMIRRSEVRYYGGTDENAQADTVLPAEFDLVVISVDCTFKDLAGSDFVAVMATGVAGPRRYILRVTNARMNLDATENEIKRQREEFSLRGRNTAILVEDKANGPAVIQHLRKEITGVIEINPEGGKIARMFATAPEWQAGNWYVDRTAAWTEMFLSQLLTFPNAAHDDMVDAASQTAIWLAAHMHRYGLNEWLEQQEATLAAARREGKILKPDDIAKVLTVKAPAPQDSATKTCPACGSAAPPQRIPAGGLRCQQCGAQWNTPKNGGPQDPMSRYDFMKSKEQL